MTQPHRRRQTPSTHASQLLFIWPYVPQTRMYGITGARSFLSPNQQCQTTEWNGDKTVITVILESTWEFKPPWMMTSLGNSIFNWLWVASSSPLSHITYLHFNSRFRDDPELASSIDFLLTLGISGSGFEWSGCPSFPTSSDKGYIQHWSQTVA